MKIRALLFLAIILLPAVHGRLSAASWPLFRGTADRAGIAREEARPPLALRWSFGIQGGFVSSPAVYKGIVYCGGRDGSVWAWDAETGEPVWQYSTSDWVDATPCVSSDTVYVPGRDGNVYAFDRLDGSLRWQAYTGSQDCSSPVLSGGRLYFLSGHPESCIYCLDAASGLILARYPVSRSGFSSPAVQNGLLYFGTNDGKFHCLNLSTGLMQWEKETEGAVFYSSLAAEGSGVYTVTGGDGRRLVCRDPLDGHALWQSAPLDNRTAAVSSVAVGGGRVFVTSTRGEDLVLYVFPVTGNSPPDVACSTAVVVGKPHESGIVSSPCVADGTVYVGSGDGNLYCIDIESGRYIVPATGDLSDEATGYCLSYSPTVSSGIVASPTVSNGRVFVGTVDGFMRCLEAQKAAYLAGPDNGDRVTDRVEMTGALRGFAAGNAVLEYGQGDQPAVWTRIAESSADAATDDLGTWDTTALADGSYSIRLTAANKVSLAAVNRLTIDNSPRPPLNLDTADTPFDGGGNVTLTWDVSADDGHEDNDVAGYRVYKSTYAGGYAELKQLSKGTTRYVDAGCPAYTTYYYVVTAFDANSESAYSNAASAFSLADGVEIQPETGGTVTLEKDGVTTELVIEPGSLPGRAWVGILAPPAYPAAGDSPNVRATPCVREFGITPAGTQFLKPVTIKIPYRPQDAAGMVRENLRIYWWDEDKQEWRIVNTSNPLAEDGKVWATIPHFSLYRVMEYTPGSEELLRGDKVYTYPNPATGATLSFKYYLGDKADVTIDVYNVAGELVAHLEKAGNPAGLVSELPWNISGIASGTYVYRLEAKAGGRSKAIKKKLAIIH